LLLLRKIILHHETVSLKEIVCGNACRIAFKFVSRHLRVLVTQVMYGFCFLLRVLFL